MKRRVLYTISSAAVLVLALAGGALAAGSAFPGAAVVLPGKPVPLQKSAARVSPSPAMAKGDKGQAIEEGCLVSARVAESPSCEYGSSSPEADVILFGDSRAAQYFPALEPIALERDWRLTVLTRGKCSFAEIPQSSICNAWKQNTLERIESVDPDLIVLGTSTEYFRDLGGTGKIDKLAALTAKTISRLKATGAEVVLMRGQSLTPWRIPAIPADCVRENMKRLLDCAWQPGQRRGHEFDYMAAKRSGITVIDPEGRFCRKTTCPIVIGNVITHRDGQHYTATFAESISPWLADKLPLLP